MNYFTSSAIRYGFLYSSYADSLRNIALEIDENPASIKNYLHLPVMDFLVSDNSSTTLERTRYLEALAYGDPGALLASPGPSLSGLMLREQGTPDQIALFYDLLKKQKMTTFFGLTEIKKGSDANNIESRLSCDFHLTAEKCFFGNGIAAEMGIVLARINNGPLGIRAIWITPDIYQDSSIEKIALPQFALKGSKISLVRFKNTKIPKECILGSHLSACESGLLSIGKVFNKLRTGVGALAIGQAQFVFDQAYLRFENSANQSGFSTCHFELETARNMLEKAAIEVDKNPFNARAVSIAKLYAVRVAERVVQFCANLFPIEQLISHPVILKASRDIFCFEFMEGTSAIQQKIIAQSLNQLAVK